MIEPWTWRHRGAAAIPNFESAPVLALGFRPFFLAAGAAAVLDVAIWLAMLRGLWPQPSHLAGIAWHAHEMLFGYLAAVLAGFLLTAVRNWTGMPTATGARLAALLGLWLAGRLAPWLGLPPWIAALVDLAFLPALAWALWRPLWHGPNPVNRVFLAVFAGMILANAFVHLDALGLLPGGASRGYRLMLDLMVLVILLVSGRVMPFFIRSVIADARPRTFASLERLTFAMATAFLVADVIAPFDSIAGGLSIMLGLIQVVRLVGWHDRRVWVTPMLTVLQAGLLWLALGLILDGLPAFTSIPARGALHALTIGAIGVLTLGMMARVAVGHTGRAMEASPLTLVAFVCINLAAVLRGLGPLLDPARYHIWLMAGGVGWILAFGLFLWVHAPMLVSARPDGRPG